jgi:hypothetical protein
MKRSLATMLGRDDTYDSTEAAAIQYLGGKRGYANYPSSKRVPSAGGAFPSHLIDGPDGIFNSWNRGQQTIASLAAPPDLPGGESAAVRMLLGKLAGPDEADSRPSGEATTQMNTLAFPEICSSDGARIPLEHRAGTLMFIYHRNRVNRPRVNDHASTVFSMADASNVIQTQVGEATTFEEMHTAALREWTNLKFAGVFRTAPRRSAGGSTVSTIFGGTNVFDYVPGALTGQKIVVALFLVNGGLWDDPPQS